MLELQRGNPDALATLVHRYHGRVFGYLYRLTNGHHLAEDLVQETFLRLAAGAGHYRYPMPFRPWLYRIASNLCRDHWKSAAVRRESLAGDVAEAAGASGSPVEEWYERREERRAVMRALHALGPDHREVIILRFYEGLSITEIALATGLPEGTVKSRLFYGLRRLRDRLKEEVKPDAAIQQPPCTGGGPGLPAARSGDR